LGSAWKHFFALIFFSLEFILSEAEISKEKEKEKRKKF
jgi:hypothetical protein